MLGARVPLALCASPAPRVALLLHYRQVWLTLWDPFSLTTKYSEACPIAGYYPRICPASSTRGSQCQGSGFRRAFPTASLLGGQNGNAYWSSTQSRAFSGTTMWAYVPGLLVWHGTVGPLASSSSIVLPQEASKCSKHVTKK